MHRPVLHHTAITAKNINDKSTLCPFMDKARIRNLFSVNPLQEHQLTNENYSHFTGYCPRCAADTSWRAENRRRQVLHQIRPVQILCILYHVLHSVAVPAIQSKGNR